ncbi:hypothetical protein ACIBKZ_18140 [Streptomyces sp. NPDC050421]|uniref:hypothetical protein n=1 Tax=Streptomyces sp. NPDC050421 TaxID=3365613 RepID=UPI003797A311
MADTSLVFNLVARDRASGVVERMGERMSTASTAIGAGIGAALGVGVATAINMDGANAKLANQLNLNEAEAARIGQVTGAVFADGFTPSVDEAAIALRGVATSMVDVGDTSSTELQKLTTQAQVLSDTFEFDLSQATQAAGSLMKSGLAANGTEAFDLITSAAQKLPQEMAGELPLLITEYAGFFDELGVTGPQMMGALTEAAKNPLFEIDKLGDAVKEFNLRIVDTKAMKDPLKELGLSVTDIQAKVNAGKGTQAFDEIVVALSKVKNQTDATRISAALMGGPGEDAKTSLLGLGKAGGFAAMGMDDAAGSTQKMVERVEGTASQKIAKFKNTAVTKLAEVGAAFLSFGMAHQGAVTPLLYALGGLAAVIMAVSVAQKVYATYSAIATVATNVMNSSTWRAIAGWTRMMAVGVMSMLRIAATSVVSAATTAAAWVGSALVGIGTWIAAVIRAAVTAAAQFLLMAARAVAWAAVMAAQWLIAMGPIGWVIAAVIALVVAIVANWDRIKAVTSAVWNWLWGKIKSIAGSILGFFLKWNLVAIFLRHWDRIKNGVILKAASLMSYVANLPGRIVKGIGNLGSLLYGKGMDVVRGLWNGIKSMGSWLKSTLTGWAKNLIPGPIAKALGIHSPSRVMATVVGRWIPAGVVDGIEDGQGVLDRKMATLVQPSSVQGMSVGRQMGGSAAPLLSAAGQGATVIRIEVAGPEEMKRLLRSIVRKDGRGSVQLAFGTGQG